MQGGEEVCILASALDLRMVCESKHSLPWLGQYQHIKSQR